MRQSGGLGWKKPESGVRELKPRGEERRERWRDWQGKQPSLKTHKNSGFLVPWEGMALRCVVCRLLRFPVG